jgi:tRNA G18 (ribose-2'-O)-methylase SpoU
VALRKRFEPEHGLFMAESHQVIARAAAAGYPVRSALTTPRWLEDVGRLPIPPETVVYVADETLMNEITGYRVHRGALAAMGRLPPPSVASVVGKAQRLVVLEAIVDHTNVGAILRSTAGLGFDGVLIDPTCADPLYRRSVRVSMGAVFAMPWTRVGNWPAGLAQLAADGFELMALTPSDEAESLRDAAADPPEKLALVLGTEGDGLSREALGQVRRHLRIPMAAGVDSLNVAAAAAVACYAFGPGPTPPRGSNDKMPP